jgi:diguanylate cyclase (GGDEF)-like protein
MRNTRLANPVDALVDRLAGRSPAALFWTFTAGAVVLVELLTLVVTLVAFGSLRPDILAIGAAVGGVTAGLISFIVVRLIARIRELQGQLEHSARTDELTGLPNRRVLFEVLARYIERAERRDAKLTVVFVDLDRFKRINDQHGHQVGDAVLREAAAVLRAGLRTYDIVSRYGGEEFVMVLPETVAWDGHAVAERIRETVAAKVFTGDVHVTISLGVADLAKGMNADRLLKAADTAVYRAKRAGRNRSEVSPAER